ncbi:hypothetical protein QCA50_013746 [Cerrena zonata]|uniref:Uncharacterized protein n=1 Tax=Cerrena zonata TaxID=2478898 RepID=A0AAW0FZI5_9APHY
MHLHSYSCSDHNKRSSLHENTLSALSLARTPSHFPPAFPIDLLLLSFCNLPALLLLYPAFHILDAASPIINIIKWLATGADMDSIATVMFNL